MSVVSDHAWRNEVFVLKTSSPPRKDPVKALILERQKAYRRSDQWMAAQLKISRQTYSRMIRDRHTDEWELGQIRKCCLVLNVTPEQFAASLTSVRR